MLTHHYRPICLSLVSTDLPLWAMIKTAATFYQRDTDRFHLIWKQPPFPAEENTSHLNPTCVLKQEGLLWLEISSQRVTLTMQGNGKLGYRHLWQKGLYGTTCYWLDDNTEGSQSYLRLKNFTQSLELIGYPLPRSLKLEYELWSNNLPLGQYLLSLDIVH